MSPREKVESRIYHYPLLVLEVCSFLPIKSVNRRLDLIDNDRTNAISKEIEQKLQKRGLICAISKYLAFSVDGEIPLENDRPSGHLCFRLPAVGQRLLFRWCQFGVIYLRPEIGPGLEFSEFMHR